jgi:RNA-directed DNA polymerase
MVTFKALYEAYCKCRRYKRNTINALAFEYNVLENIEQLERSLNAYTYKPKRSVCFLTTSPKLREVFAADFGDRVVHHLVVPLLEQIWEPKFIYDSYSNRKNKGIHQAIKRALHFSRGSKYYLQIDIKNFFYSIDKTILFDFLKKGLVNHYHKVHNTTIPLSQMLWIINKIIFTDVTENAVIKGDKTLFNLLPPHKTLLQVPKNKGLPIGNLSSQFFANVYMNQLDHFIKRTLKVKRYIRYVDDSVLFGDSKAELLNHYSQIVQYLETHLKLRLRDRYILHANHKGLDFLGYIVRPYYTLTRKRVVNNYKFKKARYLDRYEKEKGTMGYAEINASFVGHIKHSNSYRLQQKVGAIDENNPFDYDKQ